jgi:hypothetical protein
MGRRAGLAPRRMCGEMHRAEGLDAGATGAAERSDAMILLGCLLAFGLAVAPRAILALAWLFSERWPIVWGGDVLMPLLGIIFVPYTTVMYMLTWSLGGIQGWDWMWIVLGLILDVTHWADVISKRNQIPVYKDL